jgi:hypothetical protein
MAATRWIRLTKTTDKADHFIQKRFRHSILQQGWNKKFVGFNQVWHYFRVIPSEVSVTKLGRDAV